MHVISITLIQHAARTRPQQVKGLSSQLVKALLFNCNPLAAAAAGGGAAAPAGS